MPKQSGGQEGLTLVLVVMIAAILFLLSSALGTMTIAGYMNVVRQEEYIKAQCAADAGIEKTIALMQANDGWLNNFPASGNTDVFTQVFPATPVNDDVTVTYAVEAVKNEQNIGTSLAIKSLGRCDSEAGAMLAKKTLKCEVIVYDGEDYLQGLAVLPAQPASLAMPEGIIVDGDLMINGSVAIPDLPDYMPVTGDIYAGGNITGACGGLKHSNYEYIPSFPKLEENYYLQKATEDGQAFAHDVEFGAGGVLTDYNGFYYVDGNVSVAGDYRGAALIFATGAINVPDHLVTGVPGGGTTGTGEGSLTLVALGDVNIYGSFVEANIIAGGSLCAWDGAVLYGAACVGGLAYEPMEAGLLAICPVLGPAPVDGALAVNVATRLWEEARDVF